HRTRAPVQQQGFIQTADVRDAARLSVAEATLPRRGPYPLSERGQIDDPQDRTALVQQGDQRPEKRNAMDEGLGAVDRVDHPGAPGRSGVRAEFLADDPV